MGKERTGTHESNFEGKTSTHPIRAELEIKTYGRKLFDDTWDHNELVSCPIVIFIDGFGVYRNSYRSLVGIYAMIASLAIKERQRPSNMFPLSLSPHGSNLDDAVRAIHNGNPRKGETDYN